MRNAGIDQSGSLNHPVHVWPNKKGAMTGRTSPRATLVRFQQGAKFYTNGDHSVTIADIPIGTIVVVHSGTSSRIQVRVTDAS